MVAVGEFMVSYSSYKFGERVKRERLGGGR